MTYFILLFPGLPFPPWSPSIPPQEGNSPWLRTPDLRGHHPEISPIRNNNMTPEKLLTLSYCGAKYVTFLFTTLKNRMSCLYILRHKHWCVNQVSVWLFPLTLHIWRAWYCSCCASAGEDRKQYCCTPWEQKFMPHLSCIPTDLTTTPPTAAAHATSVLHTHGPHHYTTHGSSSCHTCPAYPRTSPARHRRQQLMPHLSCIPTNLTNTPPMHIK